VLTQWNDGKSGYATERAAVVFRPGEAVTVDRIEVTAIRPDAGRHYGPDADTTLRLTGPARPQMITDES
jgi:hypothetical protein